MTSAGLASGRLRELARRSAPAPSAPPEERCDLCATPIPPQHRHLLDLDSGMPQCACRACTILFDRGEAGGDHYRLIPERRMELAEFALDERLFAALGIPVDLAFVYLDSRSGRVVARYPGALGLITATPAADAWEQVLSASPPLADMQPDVEALLLYRARGARERWIVSIEDCFRLAARVRAQWTGFAGGDRVWDEIAAFFDELRAEREE